MNRTDRGVQERWRNGEDVKEDECDFAGFGLRKTGMNVACRNPSQSSSRAMFDVTAANNLDQHWISDTFCKSFAVSRPMRDIC